MRTRARNEDYLNQAKINAQAISRLLFPYAEVVIHDIPSNKIIHIENGFSKRCIGDPSDLEGFAPLPDETVIGPYEKINWDGRKLKSISIVHRNSEGVLKALLCINVDISLLDKASALLSSFILPAETMAKPQILFKEDLLDKINEYVHAYLKEKKLRLDALSKPEKEVLIKSLKKTGAFNGKRAAQYIAQVLNVSRATVYNYLK